MTNYELLNIIGEVDEDYVLAADDNVIRPRFRWQTWAVCAACAALIVAAYPVYRASRPQSPGPDSISSLEDAPQAAPDSDGVLVQRPGLHEYTLVEGRKTVITTEGSAKATAGEAEPAPISDAALPGGAYVSGEGTTNGDNGENAVDGNWWAYSAPAPDAAVQAAAEWYDALLHTYRLEENPEWYGGAWLAGDELLAVAIVDGFRTAELEAEIKEAAGAGAVLQFSTVKYSMAYLYGLVEPAARALEGSGLISSGGVDVMENCLGVDIYGDEAAVPDSVLAALAHLDPDGDAIRVRLFVGTLSDYDKAAVKGPTPDAVSTPVPGGARAEPSIETAPAPVEDSEWAMPAEDPGKTEELPQAKYDIIEGD